MQDEGAMDRLWTPWRMEYVTRETPGHECLYCWMAAGTAEDDRERLVLHRGSHNLAAVNLYPYNSGHLMIAPYAHIPVLDASATAQLHELIVLARASERILRDEYRPDAFNIGMNVGTEAGAGIPEHYHLHIVPRWSGDTSFMSTTASTRVVPEVPASTYDRLRSAFDALAGQTP